MMTSIAYRIDRCFSSPVYHKNGPKQHKAVRRSGMHTPNWISGGERFRGTAYISFDALGINSATHCGWQYRVRRKIPVYSRRRRRR